MSQKNAPNPEQNKEQVYFVEKVEEGTDFTFYLRSEGNELLLSKGIAGQDEQQSSQDEQQQSSKKRFSYSTKLNLIKVPLTKNDLKNDGNYFLDKLKEALEQAQRSESISESAWGKLLENFSGELKREIKTNGQNERKKASLLKKILQELNSLLTTKNMEEIFVDKRFQEAIKPVMSGRALICRSYQGNLLSVSFRKKSSKSTYEPDDRVSSEYPLSIKDYCDELYKAVFEFESTKEPARRGLLVIAGATNSSKSEIATGLIYTYLDKQKNIDPKRRPHLVTFEEPIEKFYASFGVSKVSRLAVKMPAAKTGIDYTPREKGNAYEEDKDVVSLKEALEDALRQTPTVLFVGETRDKEDWRRLIDFAGTGHLIVTTAHAGSLTEAMHKIFEALRVKTPAERSEIANRLLGIIHIKRYADENILIPAVWRRTPTGKNALTAEGLSSLLPYKPEKAEDVVEKGCLGRAWFAEKLTGEKESDLIKEAITWDLEGV